MKKNTAILFLNGEIDVAFCDHHRQAHYPHAPIYCADGSFCKLQQSSPTLAAAVLAVIGDGDSGASIAQQSPQVTFIRNQDSNSTDFEKCLTQLLQENIEQLIVYGASGGEMDHAISNLFIAAQFADRIGITFIDANNQTLILTPNCVLPACRGKMISIIPFSPLEQLTLTGCKYPLTQARVTWCSTPLPIRNHAIADEVSIRYQSGHGAVMISNQDYHGFQPTS